MDIISLLGLLTSYNEFYLVIMNYCPYGLPYITGEIGFSYLCDYCIVILKSELNHLGKLS